MSEAANFQNYDLIRGNELSARTASFSAARWLSSLINLFTHSHTMAWQSLRSRWRRWRQRARGEASQSLGHLRRSTRSSRLWGTTAAASELDSSDKYGNAESNTADDNADDDGNATDGTDDEEWGNDTVPSSASLAGAAAWAGVLLLLLLPRASMDSMGL